jgi:hypothetical protein
MNMAQQWGNDYLPINCGWGSPFDKANTVFDENRQLKEYAKTFSQLNGLGPFSWTTSHDECWSIVLVHTPIGWLIFHLHILCQCDGPIVFGEVKLDG